MMAERTRRQGVVGTVVSDKMQKTVVVEVERLGGRTEDGKRVRRRTRVKAHDEANACRVGDRVRLLETRPLSREKHWRGLEIVERAV